MGSGVEFQGQNVHKSPSDAMIRLLAFIGALAVTGVIAQAPVEERLPAGDTKITQGQQRLAFLRRELEGNQEKLKRMELEFEESKNQEVAAQRQLDAARKQREAGALAIERARRNLERASKAYEIESAEFERASRLGASKETRGATKK